MWDTDLEFCSIAGKRVRRPTVVKLRQCGGGKWIDGLCEISPRWRKEEVSLEKVCVAYDAAMQQNGQKDGISQFHGVIFCSKALIIKKLASLK